MNKKQEASICQNIIGEYLLTQKKHREKLNKWYSRAVNIKHGKLKLENTSTVECGNIVRIRKAS